MGEGMDTGGHGWGPPTPEVCHPFLLPKTPPLYDCLQEALPDPTLPHLMLSLSQPALRLLRVSPWTRSTSEGRLAFLVAFPRVLPGHPSHVSQRRCQ